MAVVGAPSHQHRAAQDCLSLVAGCARSWKKGKRGQFGFLNIQQTQRRAYAGRWVLLEGMGAITVSFRVRT